MGKLYSLISALLLTVCTTFAATPDSYEWWFDHDVSSAQKGTLSGRALDLEIDTSDLPKGIHYFNLRLAEGDSIYGTVYRKLFHAYGSDSDAISYEYWYDNDFEAKVTGDISKGNSTLDLDVSSLPKGIHYFNCRLGYGDGSWGTVYRRMFHTIGPDNGAISYEYWFDNDYDVKVAGSIDAGTNHFELDISNLPPGAHYYNVRLGYGDGTWGTVYRRMIVNIVGSVNAVAYEYWIDDDYSSKSAGGLSSGENSYIVDLTGVRRGLHRFNYRIMTGEGVWGAPYTSYFYSESNAARFTDYEYWLDNDYANHVSGKATGNPTSFEVDLSAFDKSGGAHYFNLRTRDDNGDWSSIYRKLLVFNETEKRQPIIGYRHYLNGDSLGYVEVERRFVDSYMFDINLPDSIYPSVKNRKPSFDGDKVYLAAADSIDYTMQIRTELGWAAPQNWKLSIGSDFSTTAVAMEINSKHTFAAPTDLGFAAMKFTAPGDSLYFRSDIPVALDIYKDGERVAALTPEQVRGMAMLRLTAGEYFGVLYGVEDAEAKDFTLHLMDTPNIVPKPEISFEDGIVTMSCSRSDAEIRYTLDGTDPTEESQLYTEVFALNLNATVKAKAFVRGSDIQPSVVAELTVDSYKSATPEGHFDASTRLLTITCATEGATISYALNAAENWIVYESPIEIRSNCTVYAKASFPGYNDSEIAEIAITELANSVPAPVINFADGMVTITCENSDAEIHYTVDGSEPSAESPKYENPFSFPVNGVVKAIAYIPGLDIPSSNVSQLIVDSYKTAMPTGVFDMSARTMTLSCATEGAAISYRIGVSGEWTDYTGPFTIGRNCTVYAKATFDGYNDSDVAEIAVTGFPDSMPQPNITFSDGRVSISCERSDALIRYTLDKTTPTMESTLYEGPFTLSHNATIRAIAYIPNSDIEPSEIAELVVDSYKTATPTGVFDLSTRTMTLSCATEGAAISYRIGAEVEWSDYTAPVSIGHNCTVYAKATFDGYNDSDIAEIVVSVFPDSMPMPVITFADGMVAISCERSDAEIRYTLDGTVPTAQSTLYTAPFSLNENAVVKAIAFIPNSDIDPSEIAEFVVDSFKTAAPYGDFNVENRILTIKCDTEGASIYYTFDLNSEWIAYSGPFLIEENGVVYAKASYPGYNDSEISHITISDMKCQGVRISYNGRYIHLATTEPDARILYSVDGSEPSSGEEYIGDFDVKGLANVRAVAIKQGYMNSDVADYVVNHYANEDHAATSAGGLIESAFEWSGSDLPNSIVTFAVEGVLNDADYRFLNSMEGLRHLDIEKVKDAHIPENAFINSKLISISLPSDLTEYGDSILSVASRLSSVVWNSRTQNLDGRLTDGLVNPNVLIYVPAEIRVETPRYLNIVTSGNATSIELHYGFPYFASRDFYADYVSLTHDFTQSTQIGICCGWETIVLPFSPQSVTHEVNGPAVPFAAWDGNPDGMKPYWLYSSTPDGWEMASKIEAGVPYIISMPNNPDYMPTSNLAGKVTFSASNINIGSASSLALSTSWINGTVFEGTFMPVEEGGLKSLNVNDTEDGLLPGSAFVAYAETVPFGAFVRGASGRKAIPLFGDESGVRLPTVNGGGFVVETPAPGMIRVSCSNACRTAIISPEGAIVRPISLDAGESLTVEGLTRGLYIVGGVKVLVK